MFRIISLLLLLLSGPLTQAADKLDYSDITKPEFFPILPWDPYHGWNAPFKERPTNGLQSMSDCNFNVSGFVMPRDLKLCRKLGLGAILLSGDDAYTNKSFFREWRKYTDAEIDARVRNMVKQGGSDPAIKGYFIMDEPGVADFHALGQAVAAVNKYAPGKFAYINLFPDYATLGAPNMSQLGTSNYTEYLERFIAEVKPPFVSYDNYKVQFSRDLQNPAEAASYYHNLLEVRRVSLAHHLPYLNIVSANQIRPETTIPSPANLMFQAYTTLAAGYRGVGWYTYYARGYHYAPIDATGHKSQTWFWLQDINRQVTALAPIMSRLTSTGVYFTSPAPAENLPLLPGNVIESVTCSTPLMVGEFTNAQGNAFAMVVNLSLEKSAKFTFKTKNPASSIKIVSALDGSLVPYDQKAGQWLVAGQGLLLAIAR